MNERVFVRALPKVADQGPVLSLRQIILRARQSVIAPQNGALAQTSNDAARPCSQSRAIFGYIPTFPASCGCDKSAAGFGHCRAGRPCRPNEQTIRNGDAKLL